MFFWKNGSIRIGTAVGVLVTFGWTVSGGNAWAERQAALKNPAGALARLAEDPRLTLSSDERQALRKAAREMAERPAARPQAVPAPASGAVLDPADEMRQIAEEGRLAADAESALRLKGRLENAHRQVLADFARTDSLLRQANLPEEIRQRQETARAEYLARMEAVLKDLDGASKSRDPREIRSALANAAEALATTTDQRPDQVLDPSRMPFRRARPTERKPSLPEQVNEQVKGALPTGPASIVAPTPADLAANEDVQITPEIQALAASLGNQPLRIYNWVRNHVEFLPTYGSVQGSQMTLDAKRGNAFDTASLLIALLRAAGVPARYVTGTIEVPAAAAMNWVGGAATPHVAQQLLGQGGVPNVGLVSGGVVTHLRIEHVWVEAFIDNIPSRGAIHHAGDTWIPLDASFKQHVFAPRSELFTANPISAVVDPGDPLFTVDESLGKVTNVDSQPMEDRLVAWAERNDQYFIEHGYPGSIGDLVGAKNIVEQTTPVFPASLPYQVLVRGAAVSTLAQGLRHYVSLRGFASELDRAFGSTSFTVKLSLPELNSRRLSFEFEPATPADADTLHAAQNGGSTLPVYLIHVVPVIRLDGVERARGASVQMGSAFFADVVFEGPDGPTTIPYRIVAGDEIAVGVTGNGVTREVLEKRFAGHPVDNPPEYFHQVQLHYWMETDAMGEAAAIGRGVHMLRLPSVGFFSSPLSVSYVFGVPRSGFYQGRAMDVRQSLIGATGEDPAKVVEFVKQSGFQGSYLEGAIFDQLSDPSNPKLKGISAVHLINDAMSQGVPIYRITSANSAAVLPLLQLSSAVESDIATAVAQGKTVLAPERNIDLGPWAGVGYIIQDETTGAGAYLISGGTAGGGWLDCLRIPVPSWETVFALLLFLLLVLIIIAAILSAPVGAPAYAAIALFLLLVGALSGSGNPGPTTA
jgi:transglutaminase-like putative cysteine protease